MFDAGIWELSLILLIALIVVGPDKLPKLATTVGRWVGKLRRFVATVQRDIDRQIAIEDQQKIRESVAQLRKDITAPLSDGKEQLETALSPNDKASNEATTSAEAAAVTTETKKAD